MKKALTLSIVIPFYNEQSYLSACLDSVAAQEEVPDEVILVDNCSTDDSLKIASRYPFVRIVQENRPGVLYARATGFDAAKSDIIGRIDADSLLPPDWTKQVKNAFAKNNVDAITGPVSYYDMPLEPLNFQLDLLIRTAIIRTTIATSQRTDFLFGSNMALKKTAWQQVRRYLCDDRDIHEDIDIAIHLQHIGRYIAYVPSLRARMSARRFDDNLIKFYHYLQHYPRSFKKHGLRSSMPYAAMTTYLVGYLLLKPLRYFYNPKTGRLSLLYSFSANRPKARKNPMYQ